MWDKLGAIIWLIVGCCLILFRKSFVRLMLRKQLEERDTPKTREYLRQLKETKLEGMLHKGLEIALVVFGVLSILGSIPELFFPQGRKYFVYILGFFALSLFAGGAAALVELLLLFRFLWGKVRKYTIERYPDLSKSIEGSTGSEKLNAIRSVPRDDPVLRALERRAIIYSIVCFVPLYLIFMFVFYVIYRVTS